MSLLKPAVNEAAYLKAQLEGFSASGKTFTAVEIALGLHAYLLSEKPIAFYDSETGSDYLLKKFDDAGVKLLVAKSRSFVDLLEFVDEAERVSDIALVDSITHVWQEIQQAFMDKINKYREEDNRKPITKLEFQHWGPVKHEWAKFTDRFLNSHLHFIICGRSGFEYDFYQEDEGAKKELIKTGTKMKAEGDFSYESSLIIQMSRVDINPEYASGKGRKGKPRQDRKVVNRAFIKKDRFDLIDGKEFDNPTFNDFLPHIERLNLGGTQRAIDTKESSEKLFNGDGENTTWYKEKRNREIMLEKIENLFTLHYPGRKDEDKKVKILLLQEFFGSDSWTEISKNQAENLRSGYLKLREKLDPDSVKQPKPADVF